MYLFYRLILAVKMLTPGCIYFNAIFIIFSMQTVEAFRRVCYFTNWSCDLLEPEAHFCIKDIDPAYCSHLIYAFANINTTTLELSPTRPDDVGLKGDKPRYERFNDFKLQYPHLKTLLSVGGSLQQSLGFSKVVESARARTIFSERAVEYLRKWKFDGIDLDWEYPGDPPETKRNYTLLLHDLRLQFSDEARLSGKTRLILSIAAPVSPEKREKGFQVENVAREVDFINLMAYDFFGGWNKIAGFNSPLYARNSDPRFSPMLNVEWTVNQWLLNGAERQKLNVGIAGYGVEYTLTNDTNYAVGAKVQGPGTKGPYRHMEGQLSYYEICELFENATYEWDPVQKSPYAYVGDQWVGFDNNRSVAEKVDWMVRENLGGVMFWSLDLDDFKGTFCKQGKFPLLRSIHEAVAHHFPDITLPTSVSTTSVPVTNVTTPETTTATRTTTKSTTTPEPTGNDVVSLSTSSKPSTGKDNNVDWERVRTTPTNSIDQDANDRYNENENMIDGKSDKQPVAYPTGSGSVVSLSIPCAVIIILLCMCKFRIM